jgi:hypothetical protein
MKQIVCHPRKGLTKQYLEINRLNWFHVKYLHLQLMFLERTIYGNIVLLLLYKDYKIMEKKASGSSPNEMDFFNLRNLSSRTMALDSTHPLTEMSTNNFPGGLRAAGT